MGNSRGLFDRVDHINDGLVLRIFVVNAGDSRLEGRHIHFDDLAAGGFARSAGFELIILHGLTLPDGGLIGGAALKAADFEAIIDAWK